jgi:peptidoglycan biosynthesis protein MviN/MurJ (putative lipid II flippase)
MTEAELFDPGLQPERTDLAWRRSTLSVAVGALIALRLLPPVLGPGALAIGLSGLLGAGLLWLLARRRARRTQQALRHQTSLPGGGLLLGLTTLTAGGAVVALIYVIINRLDVTST